ncbi:hypothetical protein LNAOJCKE_3466 [Methylorubrum aminovorans]|uniref:Uncharacterized protein n=1 Tax=Methylorubrum aminovorans TaxID=269069 RepID=A0ABQ4UG54_9HYPH|nr:hypothetical protein [Methylorubrum aminovorans]GJE66249.1 hypothetical protein LNAOJCKE_3466 [Methylorubrum aminovorans]GMA76495.1 hypothetical protein GCM10025880_29120 [Methylorubrum aminovorans]
MAPHPTLFDEASAHLPLFDDLSDATVDRLAVGGFGRGLLTASLRARLRKGGFAHMGALALATPAGLMALRKVGPVRVGAIRAHILDELARFLPDARAMHDRVTTDWRRLDRLRTVPVGALGLVPALIERFGSNGPGWADLAALRRIEVARTLGVSGAEVDGIVSALVRAVRPDPRSMPSPRTLREGDTPCGMDMGKTEAELLRERDREWDEAAPERRALSRQAT